VRPNVRPRTLAAGNTGNADWRYLAQRRLALFILSSIEHGTRWVVTAPRTEIAERLTAQVRAFFEALHEAGAFGPRRSEDSYFVICDERVNHSQAVAAAHAMNEVQFVIGYAASREHEFHCFRVAQSAAGSKVQPVSLNRLNFAKYSPAELEWVESIASQLQP